MRAGVIEDESHQFSPGTKTDHSQTDAAQHLEPRMNNRNPGYNR